MDDWSEDLVELEPTIKRLFKAFNTKDYVAAAIHAEILSDIANSLYRHAIKEQVKCDSRG